MTRRNFILAMLVACTLCLSCCISCKTADPEIITEYVYVEPEYPDITPAMQMLFDSRPNDSEQMQIIPKDQVTTSLQLLYNSWQYQCAWERWEDYAVNLEEYLKGVAEELDSLS